MKSHFWIVGVRFIVRDCFIAPSLLSSALRKVAAIPLLQGPSRGRERGDCCVRKFPSTSRLHPVPALSLLAGAAKDLDGKQAGIC